MKNIIIVVPSLVGGGAERISINIANNLDYNKFNVTIVSCTGENEYKGFINSNVCIKYLNMKSMKTSIFKLSKILQSCEPDIVICMMEHTYLFTLIAKKMSKVNSKIILAIHNNYENLLKYSTTNIKTKTLHYIYKWTKIYNYSDKIIFVSKDCYLNFKKIFNIKEDKGIVIYNPVIYDEINILKEEIVELDENYRYILSVGRLAKQKDYITMLKSINYIINELNIKDIKLIIVGKGELEDELKSIAKQLKLDNNVIFWGFETNPYKLMSKCEVFVLSSIYEGLPTVLIEAMYCGAIPISTDCDSGPREIIDNGIDGYLVAVGDYKAIADKIVQVLYYNDDMSNSKLSYNAYVKGNKFHVDKIIVEYENIINSLIEDKNV